MKKFQLIAFVALLLLAGCEKEKQECEQGYTGPNCTEQVTPSLIKISKITVTSMPSYNNGDDWDFWSAGPDIYIKVYVDSEEVFESNSYYEDADPNVNYDFEINPPITVKDAYSTVAISLFDYDTGSSDDFMGGIYNELYEENNSFPSVIHYYVSDLAVTYKVHVTYRWE